MSTISTSRSSAFDLLGRPSQQLAQVPSDPRERFTLIDDSLDANAKRAEAREAAEALVSTSFIKPILAQLRESNNAPAPFGPTQAEKQFGALLDTQLADEISRAAQFPIVDRLVEQFTSHLPKANESAPGIDLSA
jgi:Rod binding domain-containing protein